MYLRYYNLYVFPPHISGNFFLFLFLIPFFIFMLPAVAFAKLGINPFAGLLFFWFCLMESFINIPVYRKELTL